MFYSCCHVTERQVIIYQGRGQDYFILLLFLSQKLSLFFLFLYYVQCSYSMLNFHSFSCLHHIHFILHARLSKIIIMESVLQSSARQQPAMLYLYKLESGVRIQRLQLYHQFLRKTQFLVQGNNIRDSKHKCFWLEYCPRSTELSTFIHFQLISFSLNVQIVGLPFWGK